MVINVRIGKKSTTYRTAIVQRYSEKVTSPKKKKRRKKKLKGRRQFSGNCVWLSGRMCACMVTHIHSKSMDQSGKAANPARGQLKRENKYFPVLVHA